MKLSEHIEACQALIKERGDLECYYARDEEGNSYEQLCFSPSIYYVKSLDYMLDSIYNEEDKEEHFEENLIPICIIN